MRNLEVTITSCNHALYLRRLQHQNEEELPDTDGMINLHLSFISEQQSMMMKAETDRARMAAKCKQALISIAALLLLFLLLPGPLIAKLLHYEQTAVSLIKADRAPGLLLYTKEEDYPNLPSGNCDYSQGEWVRDEGPPLYSGRECKPWLADIWACRFDDRRSSFDYESYRWQPDQCDLPLFYGYTFLKRLQDKTVAFVGDSLGRQQFQSLMCLITGGKNDTFKVEDVASEYGFSQAPGSRHPDGWSYRFPITNTTLLFYWSATLADLKPLQLNKSSNGSTQYPYMAMHIDRPPSFLRKNLARFDVLVLNSGHHWNQPKLKKNKWKLYTDGKRLSPLLPLHAAYNLSLHNSLQWVDQHLDADRQLVFLQTLSPRHFFHGDWDTGGRCDNTKLKAGRRVLRGPLVDDVAESAARGTRIRLLNITLLSQYRDEAHISRYSPKFKNGSQDCLHWCLPGVPDTWNHIFYAHLLKRHQVLSN